MPFVTAAEAVHFTVHGSEFISYAAPSRGSSDLCAWRLQVPAGLRGQPHRPSRSEVILVLDGELQITIDGDTQILNPGDVAVIPAGAEMRADGGPTGASAWVTTTPGLEATLSDGTRFSPPWAQ